jgi:ubiquinone/menaquinone biosynthesis C-methylase UbiE
MSDQTTLQPILDACCGGRMMWFDKNDARALFLDNREETWEIGGGHLPFRIQPDVLGDFTALPFPAESFTLVVFDPPHILRQEARGWITRKYGVLNGEWREMLRQGFAECFRVLKPGGTLIFKWSDSNVSLPEILRLTNEKPLFGTRTGKLTHWVAFFKS